MPRRARLQAAGLPVHIIQRGNNRQACFFADDDYLFFLDHLAQLAKRFRCALIVCRMKSGQRAGRVQYRNAPRPSPALQQRMVSDVVVTRLRGEPSV